MNAVFLSISDLSDIDCNELKLLKNFTHCTQTRMRARVHTHTLHNIKNINVFLINELVLFQ